MDDWVLMIGNVWVATAAAMIAYSWGVRKGVQTERTRVVGLLQESLYRRWSATTRWVLNAVMDNRTSLLQEKEFFSDEAGD